MATNVQYGEVLLKNVLTRDWMQEPIREQSDTDQIHHRFNITVEAIVNRELLTDGPQDLGVFGAPIAPLIEYQRALNRLLGVDRQLFQYAQDGAILLEVNSTTDADNGPKVKALKILSITAATIKISFSIQVAAILCSETTSPVISNRWSCADDIDDQYRTKRVWRGRLRVRNAIHNPQDFRGLVVPRIAKSFKRITQHFHVNPNALEMDYTITDQEMIGEAPPGPAVKMTVRHTEAMGATGQNNVGSITVRLDGARGSDRRLLFQRAVQIVVAKLQVNNLGKGENSGIFKSLELTEHIGENQNAVEANAIVQRVPKSATVGDLGAILTSTLAVPLALQIPDYDPDVVAPIGPYGTAGDSPAGLAGLFACYLQSPCSSNHGMPYTPDYPASEPATQGDEAPTTSTYSVGPLSDQVGYPDYSTEHLESVYTFSTLESIIELSENRLAMPIARANGDVTVDTYAVIRLAPATAKRRIKVSSERIGDHPKIFLPKDFTDGQGIRHSLLTWRPIFQPPQQTSTGQGEAVVDVEYVYAMNRPPSPGENISIGSLPWDNATANVYPSSAFIEPDSAKGIA